MVAECKTSRLPVIVFEYRPQSVADVASEGIGGYDLNILTKRDNEVFKVIEDVGGHLKGAGDELWRCGSMIENAGEVVAPIIVDEGDIAIGVGVAIDALMQEKGIEVDAVGGVA